MITAKPFKKRCKISNHFGRIINPDTGKEEFNMGITFDMPEGTPLYAIVKGKVITGFDNMNGNFVQLFFRTENFLRGYFIYSNLSSIIVLDNKKIRQGAIIGFSGKTGKTNSAILNLQLHLMINGKNYVPVNLANYVNIA